jgi:transcription initiation factor TFIIIB Brf1 subunit/transcription initiation factor TFIIB
MQAAAAAGLHAAVDGLTRGRPRRGMLRRAVFSDCQRRGLERTFHKQKYISKPDRKKLAERLGLKDSQVGRLRERFVANKRSNIRCSAALRLARFL